MSPLPPEARHGGPVPGKTAAAAAGGAVAPSERSLLPRRRGRALRGGRAPRESRLVVLKAERLAFSLSLSPSGIPPLPRGRQAAAGPGLTD